jgi:LemA protein
MQKYLKYIIPIGLIFALVMSIVGPYNSLTTKQENVNQAQAKIETQLQRRHDLIPNVVAVVQKYMSHEKEVFTQIADARSKIGSNNKDEKQQGEQELSSAISRLLVLSENYPQLKADAQATNLITELEGTENRIATARIDYNKVATEYNKSIRRFPTNITAKLFDFEKVELTKADEGAKKAPKVNFN